MFWKPQGCGSSQGPRQEHPHGPQLPPTGPVTQPPVQQRQTDPSPQRVHPTGPEMSRGLRAKEGRPWGRGLWGAHPGGGGLKIPQHPGGSHSPCSQHGAGTAAFTPVPGGRGAGGAVSQMPPPPEGPLLLHVHPQWPLGTSHRVKRAGCWGGRGSTHSAHRLEGPGESSQAGPEVEPGPGTFIQP